MTTQRYTGKIYSSSQSFVLNDTPTATSDVSYLIHRWQEDVNDGTGDVVAGTPDVSTSFQENDWNTYTIESVTGDITPSGNIISSLAIVDTNRPAVAYYDSSTDDLKFAINANSSGTGAWSIQTVDSTGNVGHAPSLTVVNGTPAIAYFDITNSTFKFSINANADGSGAWSLYTIETIATSTLSYISLVVVSGNPAVAYYDSVNNNLKFARNANVDGSGAWSIQTVDSTGDVGAHAHMAIVSSNPAIVYRDFTNTTLKYTRNANADGSGAWSSNVIDNTGTIIGNDAKLIIADGKPAVAFYAFISSATIRFAINAIADGSGAWSVQTVDNIGTTNLSPSATIVNGHPAIAYRNDNTISYTENANADGSGAWFTKSIESSFVSSTDIITLSDGTPIITYRTSSTLKAAIKNNVLSLRFPTSLSSVDDYYNGWWIRITNNSPVGILDEVRQITDYVGATRTPTFSSAWDAGTPTDTTSFSLYSSSYASLFWDESADRLVVAGQPRHDNTTITPSTFLDLQASELISTTLTTTYINNGISTTSGGAYTAAIANNTYTLAGSYNAAVASQSGSFSSGSTNCLTAASQTATTSNTVDECAIIASATADIDGSNNTALIATNGSSTTSSSYSVAAGAYGDLSSATYSLMSGGALGSTNSITTSNQAICLGGISNAISTSTYSGIIAGTSNTMQATSTRSLMLGGQTNTLQGSNSVVIGGGSLTVRGNHNIMLGSRTDSIELGVNGTTYNHVAIESIPFHIAKNSSASATITASEIANGILTLVDTTSYTLDTTANMATKFGVVANTFAVAATRPTFRVLGVLGAATETCDISLGTGQTWTNNSTSTLNVTGSIELILTFTSTTTMDVSVVGAGGGSGSSDITVFGSWTPTIVSGFSSLTVNAAQYQRTGNKVLILYDISVTANATATSATIGGLPLAIAGFGTGNKIANPVWIDNTTDVVSLLGRAVLDQTATNNVVFQVNTFTNTKNYDIVGQLEYTVSEASALYLWTDFTPSAGTGLGSLTNNKSQYHLVGTKVTIIIDVSVVANATGSSIVIGNMPYAVNFSGGVVTSTTIVENTTDVTNFFGQVTLSGSNLTVTGASNFENTKGYDIQLQINYPI